MNNNIQTFDFIADWIKVIKIINPVTTLLQNNKEVILWV